MVDEVNKESYSLQETKGNGDCYGGSIRSTKGRPSVNGTGSGGGGLHSHKLSKPKYMEGWGVADKPFANITEGNASNAKGIAMTVRDN